MAQDVTAWDEVFDWVRSSCASVSQNEDNVKLVRDHLDCDCPLSVFLITEQHVKINCA